MKISKRWPELQKEKALVIVTGKQDAVFYYIRNGEMERLDAFKIPRPHYSDNEGHFKRRGHGKMMGSGGAKELRDQDVINDFLREFKEHLKSLPKGFRKLYLMTPAPHKNALLKALPREYKERLDKLVEGNYYYRNQEFLLGKISQAPRMDKQRK